MMILDPTNFNYICNLTATADHIPVILSKFAQTYSALSASEGWEQDYAEGSNLIVRLVAAVSSHNN